MSRNINIEKRSMTEIKPWLTVQFYKIRGNKKGFDLKINISDFSEHEKSIVLESENIIRRWLNISEEEFNEFLVKKLEETYPQLRNLH